MDCIYEGERMLYIHPDECVDCGACEPVCPVEAIYYEDDVPAQWADYTRNNAEFFTELDSPGGASKTGALPYDHPSVTALPPQGSPDQPLAPWTGAQSYTRASRIHGADLDRADSRPSGGDRLVLPAHTCWSR